MIFTIIAIFCFVIGYSILCFNTFNGKVTQKSVHTLIIKQFYFVDTTFAAVFYHTLDEIHIIILQLIGKIVILQRQN
ncbi:hypothetical protein PRLR5107_12940 [Prevotella lacticifex]|uniref:Uncharacterized protein n=1 Tax=Prevotella lacticifex TaxID=2854755 RepID=A0A9R1CWS3_9BACT|nr:hypothetical protein PRLR5003_07370 [Prevotella lacticifex]GJG39372.1 hypothetical protein PRLR5019_13430 [Prevotella lacticifex]GJG41948.1 hypothetical protein PRLR5025_07340 [Prevotella lacticifex]GJG45726.1 hypothetical protein PRLR5027_13210 [Prevotella lacticifex]GJG48299.1 hypothetical protein PRLR5052_07120 [Prevotella lacticifex]